jgi:hypothetical protein
MKKDGLNAVKRAVREPKNIEKVMIRFLPIASETEAAMIMTMASAAVETEIVKLAVAGRI